MRFMLLLKATADYEAGREPAPAIVAALAKYNESMAKAGVLLDMAGLRPGPETARVRILGNRRSVTDGPFAESKELIAGYWMIQVKSQAEAIEWARRFPSPDLQEELEIEVRQVYDAAECPTQRLGMQRTATEHTESAEGRTTENPPQ
ncbi:MAG: YciI family protein [Planctomycetaceae bacterium]|nr:YciI family protein [Planctomycetaceae bacterium]